ncbi:MAG: molybdopterin molybdotransferase MoeA [Desulfobacteraceae bacterium]|nr:molybdopterin molybdotransferase MoeA [Desulfobacteraceae bacterium]
MAGIGLSQVFVYRRPRVAIISTGDEVVPVDQRPEPGQVRDINTYTLSAFCWQSGAEPQALGLCKDDFEELKARLEKGLREADTVLISGGSSVGTRDMTLRVFESFHNVELLVHGISISPGKPTIIARIGSKAVFGLPGHTASAMVVAEVFLNPFLSRLSGKGDFPEPLREEVEAELSRNIESASGREDYIRVRLVEKEGKFIADPIFGKSGLISTLVEADGLIRVERNTEGLYEGDRVKVMFITPEKGGFR